VAVRPTKTRWSLVGVGASAEQPNRNSPPASEAQWRASRKKGYMVSTFSGRQGKGAMRQHRAMKRAEAEARNAEAGAIRYLCGHVHGLGRDCRAAS